MRPTPVMTPSASTSAIFRLSAAWCCTFFTNSSLIALARAICEAFGIRDRWGKWIHGNIPLWCGADTPSSRRPVVCTLLGCPFLHNTKKRGTTQFAGVLRVNSSMLTLENSCQNAKQRDRPRGLINTVEFISLQEEHTAIISEARLENFLSHNELIYDVHSRP